jgi:hypothetical protein
MKINKFIMRARARRIRAPMFLRVHNRITTDASIL